MCVFFCKDCKDCKVIKVSKDCKDNKRKKNGIAITSDRYLDIQSSRLIRGVRYKVQGVYFLKLTKNDEPVMCFDFLTKILKILPLACGKWIA